MAMRAVRTVNDKPDETVLQSAQFVTDRGHLRGSPYAGVVGTEEVRATDGHSPRPNAAVLAIRRTIGRRQFMSLLSGPPGSPGY